MQAIASAPTVRENGENLQLLEGLLERLSGERQRLERLFADQERLNRVLAEGHALTLAEVARARLEALKEAALKSIGEGLPLGLDTFEFELEPTPRVVRAPPDQGRPERFDAYWVEGTGGCAALAIRS